MTGREQGKGSNDQPRIQDHQIVFRGSRSNIRLPLPQSYIEWFAASDSRLDNFESHITGMLNGCTSKQYPKLITSLKYNAVPYVIKWMAYSFPRDKKHIDTLKRIEKIDANNLQSRPVRHAQDDISVASALNHIDASQNARTVHKCDRPFYKERPDKSVNAPDFLLSYFQKELEDGEITLSSLRSIDPTLWAGLRNWANAGNHDLDAIIPRGRARPGAGPMALGFDPKALDPRDPRDALALEALRIRERTRERVRQYRSRKLNPA